MLLITRYKLQIALRNPADVDVDLRKIPDRGRLFTEAKSCVRKRLVLLPRDEIRLRAEDDVDVPSVDYPRRRDALHQRPNRFEFVVPVVNGPSEPVLIRRDDVEVAEDRIAAERDNSRVLLDQSPRTVLGYGKRISRVAAAAWHVMEMKEGVDLLGSVSITNALSRKIHR